MIGRIALGGICAGLSLYVAMQSDNEAMKASAVVIGSCVLGFTATSLVLERSREHKTRQADAEVYLEFLRQLNQQRSTQPQIPNPCRGCLHYHGRTYHGNLLVCGMHPYGVEDEWCEDWEEKDK